MYNCIVIHYSEIGIKGKNRDFFEKKLIQNVKTALRKNVKRVYRRYGRIVCNLSVDVDIDEIKQILGGLPGIAYFSFAVKSKLELDEIKKKSLDLLENEKFTTFKVVSKRSYKEFPLTSQELNEVLGDHVSQSLGKKAKMKEPDVKLYVEICEKEAFIYRVKHHGIGGLPVSTGGKLICSLSGGIDSPVASFLMMKRGCKVVFVHIFNETLAKKSVLTKLDRIVKQLTNFQLDSKLYIIPFEKIQREIIKNVLSRFRMIVYRRFMMRIVNEIAKIENAKGIVTGDSIGQVASQTLENLRCIQHASKLPVFTPLIGMNKEEIIENAKKIGTYDYSIMPYPDCCSFMIAKHPEIKGDVDKITQMEDHIKNQKKLIEESISEARVKVFEFS